MCEPRLRTLVLHHPECLEHGEPGGEDWEGPDRVTAILSKIAGESDKVVRVHLPPHPCTDAFVQDSDAVPPQNVYDISRFFLELDYLVGSRGG